MYDIEYIKDIFDLNNKNELLYLKKLKKNLLLKKYNNNFKFNYQEYKLNILYELTQYLNEIFESNANFYSLNLRNFYKQIDIYFISYVNNENFKEDTFEKIPVDLYMQYKRFLELFNEYVQHYLTERNTDYNELYYALVIYRLYQIENQIIEIKEEKKEKINEKDEEIKIKERKQYLIDELGNNNQDSEIKKITEKVINEEEETNDDDDDGFIPPKSKEEYEDLIDYEEENPEEILITFLNLYCDFKTWYFDQIKQALERKKQEKI